MGEKRKREKEKKKKFKADFLYGCWYPCLWGGVSLRQGDFGFGTPLSAVGTGGGGYTSLGFNFGGITFDHRLRLTRCAYIAGCLLPLQCRA